MKFQFLGRLRGSDSDNSTDTSPGGLNTEEESFDSPALGGGSLERTVESMFEQGYSEEEIKQELQGQYDPQQISQVVNSAVTSQASPTGGPEAMTPYQGDEEPVSPMDQGFNDNPDNDTRTGYDQPPPQPQQQQPIQEPVQQPEPQQEPVNPDSNVEELVETIVAENLDQIEREFENLYEEIDEMKESIDDFEQRIHDLEIRDDEDQTQFIQKMDEMENHLDSYQSRIGGLEKAFQQVLPSLVDNVRDLSDLVQEMKAEKGIKTEKNVSSQDIQDIDMEDWD